MPRHLIEVLVGPCSEDEAIDFMDELIEAVEHYGRNVGAVFALKPLPEEGDGR